MYRPRSLGAAERRAVDLVLRELKAGEWVRSLLDEPTWVRVYDTVRFICGLPCHLLLSLATPYQFLAETRFRIGADCSDKLLRGRQSLTRSTS